LSFTLAIKRSPKALGGIAKALYRHFRLKHYSIPAFAYPKATKRATELC
jgi:hypothetical protein